MDYRLNGAGLLLACALSPLVQADEIVEASAHPAFANPQFINAPLDRAYPGQAYDARLAVKGGRCPYRFEALKAPEGLQVDARKGTLKWTAPAREPGAYDIEVKVTDADGKAAQSAFKLSLSKEGFYFVSPEGDDGAAGTFEKPWKTIERAAMPPAGFTYPAGAVICVRGGVYTPRAPAKEGAHNENIVRITKDSPKRWIAYPGELPVIDFGWSEARHKAVLDAVPATAPTKDHTARGYGHRFSLDGGADGFYFDGFEVRNACYYMFALMGGVDGATWRRCNFHHLSCDSGENPAFIFTFSVDKQGARDVWGEHPQANYHRALVIQDNAFHDRVYLPSGGHGGALVFYTVRDAVVEDNRFERIQGTGSMATVSDKDSGWGNTYRGNWIEGGLHVMGQWFNDEIEICHNVIQGELYVGNCPGGWLRNIWIHHNVIRGPVRFFIEKTAYPPESELDLAPYDLSAPDTADSVRLVREGDPKKALINFYRNVLLPAPKDSVSLPARKEYANEVLCAGKGFARWYRIVNWDENLVHENGRIRVAGSSTLDWALMKNAGLDARGQVAAFDLDAQLRLPPASSFAGKYGPLDRAP